MESPYRTRFSDIVLTGVFAGIAATLLSMVYYLAFKDITGYPLSSLLNVSSLIFVINTIFLGIGFLYYWLSGKSKKGNILYMLVSIALTAVAIYMTTTSHRSDIKLIDLEFHELIGGILAIMGLTAAFGIPFLFNNRFFNEHVL